MKNGDMKIGWLKLENEWYYLNSSGEMLIGTHTIDGKIYTFNQSGVLV